jgi:hypothetical protein
MIPHAANLAVVAGARDKSDGLFDLSRGEFHGTAFAIAPGLFLTAGHVYKDAAASGHSVALGRLTPENVEGAEIRDAEVFESIDLALLQCPTLEAQILMMKFGPPLSWFDDVYAMGWGFGLDVGTREINRHTYQLRAFKGYVVNRRGLTELPGVPPGYEVSFVPPPGLSGAPLVQVDGVTKWVRGIVLKQYAVEVGERRMDLGVALDVQELLTLDSRIVGGSFASLFGLEKLPRRSGKP